ncbi:MAG: hypothetical protein ACTSXG_01285 [Alphaproteobacteria bacterium]
MLKQIIFAIVFLYINVSGAMDNKDPLKDFIIDYFQKHQNVKIILSDDGLPLEFGLTTTHLEINKQNAAFTKISKSLANYINLPEKVQKSLGNIDNQKTQTLSIQIGNVITMTQMFIEDDMNKKVEALLKIPQIKAKGISTEISKTLKKWISELDTKDDGTIQQVITSKQLNKEIDFNTGAQVIKALGGKLFDEMSIFNLSYILYRVFEESVLGKDTYLTTARLYTIGEFYNLIAKDQSPKMQKVKRAMEKLYYPYEVWLNFPSLPEFNQAFKINFLSEPWLKWSLQNLDKLKLDKPLSPEIVALMQQLPFGKKQ